MSQPMVAFPAPDSGLSESESKIMTRLLELLSGPLNAIVEQKLADFSSGLNVQISSVVDTAVCKAVSSAFDTAVEKAVDRVVERAGATGSSQGSSSGSFGVDTGTGDRVKELWLCPFCLFPCKNEHSFDEHIKKVLTKLSVDTFKGVRVVRRSAEVKRTTCVFDPSDSIHQQYIAPWKRLETGADDFECCRSFIYGMRQLLTPGAHRGFASSTGHIHDIRDFLQRCADGSLKLVP
jgi:hypothetical protein